MDTAQTFLTRIERFLKRHEMPATTFGREAVGDPNFMPDIRSGRMPSLRLVDRVNAYMREYRALQRAG